MAQEEAVVPGSLALPTMKDLTHPRIMLGVPPRMVDLSGMPPMTLRDRKELAKLGCPIDKIGEFSPDQEGALVLYLLRKLDVAATQDEVDALPNPVVQDVIWCAMTATREVDRPFSRRSTALP